jgi:hypothetical protein
MLEQDWVRWCCDHDFGRQLLGEHWDAMTMRRQCRFWGMSVKSMLETGESVARTRLWPEDCNRERTTS